MSESHLALVRAEIKSWERDFAGRHGRDPSVQDIRDQPSIAEKYRLYKKLSKAVAATKTPPGTHACLPAPKPRPAESVPPLTGFNPFSPVKKSVRHDHILPLPASPSTPTRIKPKPCTRTTNPSPDPLSSILPPHPNANPSCSLGRSVSTAAVSRARKRLRGEPVSPSPSKPKRRRIRQQAFPSLLKLDPDSSDSEHEVDQDLPQCDFTSSFVADSPVKAPAGGKPFKLLFDDALPALSVAKKPVGLDSGLDTRLSQQAFADHPKLHHDLKSKDITSGPEHRVNHIQAKSSAVVSQASQQRTSIKRTLDSSNLVSLQPQYSLIPPSPPPQDSVNPDTGKKKAKTATGRKKSRVESDESDRGVDSPDDITLKVVTVKLDRRNRQHADDFEWDPLLHLGTRNHDPAAEEQIDANRRASGTFSVDLPDRFRRVLAISPPRNGNSTEERVTHELLYGGRVGHYDPSRGGDIWDAGETDERAFGDTETEDDWEGEPVPWEVGEL